MIHIKTWEVYKIGIENPKAKFLCSGSPSVGSFVACFNEVGKLVDNEGGSLVYPTINTEFELIPQEVPWQEAIQAWLEGKTIYCETTTGRCEFEGTDTYYQALVDRQHNWTVNKEKLLHCKWYIE